MLFSGDQIKAEMSLNLVSLNQDTISSSAQWKVLVHYLWYNWYVQRFSAYFSFCLSLSLRTLDHFSSLIQSKSGAQQCFSRELRISSYPQIKLSYSRKTATVLWAVCIAMKCSDAVVTDVDKVGGGWEGQAKRVLKYQNTRNSFPFKDLPFCVEINSWGKKHLSRGMNASACRTSLTRLSDVIIMVELDTVRPLVWFSLAKHNLSALTRIKTFSLRLLFSVFL